jgi:parvulin-like peptidyl-prolyl isomerase
MKYLNITCALILLAVIAAPAQVASHAPTAFASPSGMGAPAPAMQVVGRPVAKVNGAVLTDRDLQREMFTMFPYARQHNGEVPKEMEPGIRAGAMKMIIFEELVYQDAVRRKITISPQRMAKAQTEFRKQFSSPAEYQQFLKVEFQGSEKLLQQKIQRSLLIDALLRSEVDNKAVVTLAEVRQFYDKNPARFQYPESFSFQTITILPPDKATAGQLQEARKRAQDALRQAKATKNEEDFGMLAEKISEDDYRVMMGFHKAVDRSKLPPAVVQVMLKMQPGQVSDIIQVEQASTIVRLYKHTPAGQFKFEEIKLALQKDLQKDKTNTVRAAFDKKLQQTAKVEVL